MVSFQFSLLFFPNRSKIIRKVTNRKISIGTFFKEGTNWDISIEHDQLRDFLHENKLKKRKE